MSRSHSLPACSFPDLCVVLFSVLLVLHRSSEVLSVTNQGFFRFYLLLVPVIYSFVVWIRFYCVTVMHFITVWGAEEKKTGKYCSFSYLCEALEEDVGGLVHYIPIHFWTESRTRFLVSFLAAAGFNFNQLQSCKGFIFSRSALLNGSVIYQQKKQLATRRSKKKKTKLIRHFYEWKPSCLEKL